MRPRPGLALAAAPALLAAGAAGLMASTGPLARHARRGFPLDDAWIHQVYAQALARFQGLAYNPGQQETGATSPLWALVSAPVHWLGAGAVPVGIKVLGVLLAAAAAVLLAGLVARWSGSRAAGLIAGALLAVDPRLTFAALSGMETPLVLALWLGAAWALQRDRVTLGYLLTGLAPLARPEAVLAVPFLVALAPSGLRRPRPLAALVVPGLLWISVCLAVSGRPLPATFYAKSRNLPLDLSRLRAAWELLRAQGWAATLLLPAGLAAAAVAIGRWGRRGAPLGLFLSAVVYLLGVVLSRAVRPDGYYWTRWTDPPALVLTAVAVAGLSALAVRAPGPSRARWAIPVLALAVVALSLPRLAESWRDRRFHLGSDTRAIEVLNVQAGRWLAAHAGPDAVIGVNDAGAIRWFSGHRTLDLKGLNHHRLLFGETSPSQAVAACRWLAIFPSWFSTSNLLDYYEVRRRLTIPVSDYTICRCPEQTELILAELKPEYRAP